MTCALPVQRVHPDRHSGMIFLPTVSPQGWTISKRRTNLVRHRDLADRKNDQAVCWSSLCSKLRREFQSEGVRIFSDSQWLGYIHRGSNKPRFPYYVNSDSNHLYVRAIQGHSGGDLIAPELLNYVAVPLGGKECLYHVNSSFAVNFILQAGLIAGGRDTEEGRQTVLFTPLDPFRDETEEEYDYVSKPRKVHCENMWKLSQDTVSWVNLENAYYPL